MLNSFESHTFMSTIPGGRALAPQQTVTRNAALAEGKIPIPHRFHLVDGRVIDGYIYRGVNSRLVDELYGQKGSFVSVIDAQCTTSGKLSPYMAINERHIVSMEELTDLPGSRSQSPEVQARRSPEG